MRYKWDQKKNKILMSDRNRGLSFERVSEIFAHAYYLDEKNDDPEQFRAIGIVGGKLFTLIFEIREDLEGEYYHFVTYWPSTKTERKLYEGG